MIRNLTRDGSSDFPHYDICIVGSGPAGMTVCAELKDTALRICLLESGGFEKSLFADKLRCVEDIGLKLDKDSQERILGGTSETWSGLCAPLDPIDFERRPFPHSIGWPIAKADLDPYYEQACARYKFPNPKLFSSEKSLVFGPPNGAQFSWECCEEKMFLKPSPIYRFSSELRDIFSCSENLDVVIEATVTQLVSDQHPATGQARIHAAIFKTPDGNEYQIRAKSFVLATGAIESARILLNSKGRSGCGLGNEHDQVGRYLMNHPKGRSGLIRLNPPMDASKCFSWRSYSDGTGFVGVRLRDETQRNHGLLNSYVMVTAHYPWSNRDEPEAFRAVIAELQALIPQLTNRRDFRLGDWSLWRRYIADLKSLRSRWRPLASATWRALLCTPIVIWLVFVRALTGRRKQVSAVSFMNYTEMEPNAENRVSLGTGLDALGVPIPQVRHRLGRRDLESLHSLQEFIARELERQGHPGILESSPESLASTVTTDACHYLGTTRMGTDPTKSVVDPNLRVHSVENLYVAGGSVFPSSGCANPTMTIVALSIRLAEHLRGKRGAG